MLPTAGSTLTAYRDALKVLPDNPPAPNNTSLSPEQALKILCARDALQNNIGAPIDSNRLQQILTLDSKLRQNTRFIIEALPELSTYRDSLPKKPEGWWWYLDEQQAPHLLDRHDWISNGLTFGSWTISIALLVNIASRFLSGGPDVLGAAAVILPTLLALLQAKSNLTDTGQQGAETGQRDFDGLIKRLFPPFLQAEAKFASTFLLLLGLLLFWSQLPRISEQYSRWGLRDYRARELGSAEGKYKTAIALDPNNVNAHHNLGRLYEDWLRFDAAKQEYQIAVSGEVPRAYNNLARLYLREGKKENFPEAVSLLLRGQQLVKDQQFLPEEARSVFPEDEYNLSKNLGWARFEQKRDEEAEKALKAAITIATDPKVSQYLLNRASAHCILAQVLERQKRPDAIEQWNHCQKLGNPEIPEEDTWMHLANQALKRSQTKTQ